MVHIKRTSEAHIANLTFAMNIPMELYHKQFTYSSGQERAGRG